MPFIRATSYELPVAFQTPMPSAPMKRGRPGHLWQLDVLRAAAVLLVIFYHLYGGTFSWDLLNQALSSKWLSPTSGGAAWLLSPLVLGYVGVMLFFVLSGFCIHHSILQAAKKMTAAEHAPPRRHRLGLPFSFASFIWRRGWRIYPAYLAVLVVVVIGLRLFPPHTIVTRNEFLAHVLMVHNFRPNYEYSINAVFWSLAVEWQFYLIYPLFLLLRRHVGIGRTVLLAYALSVATQIFIHVTGRDSDSNPTWLVWTTCAAVTWCNWCLGAMAADYWNRGRRLFPLPAWTLPPLILGVVAIYSNGYLRRLDQAEMLWAVVFAFMIEAYLHHRRSPRRLEKWLIPIGLCSYSLYLVHLPLVWVIFAGLKFVNFPGHSLLAFAAGGLLVGAISLVIAWVCFRFIEMPGVRIGTAIWKKLGQRITGIPQPVVQTASPATEGSVSSPASPMSPAPAVSDAHGGRCFAPTFRVSGKLPV